MIHRMKLNAEPFKQIVTEKKTIELRLNDPKRQKINVGDIIVFNRTGNIKQETKVKVVTLHKFASFGELYEQLPLEKCGYSPNELTDASSADMMQYYTAKEEHKWGVLAIEIKCMDG